MPKRKYNKPSGHRTKKVVVLLTSAEKKALESSRRKSRLSRSEFIRARVFPTETTTV